MPANRLSSRPIFLAALGLLAWLAPLRAIAAPAASPSSHDAYTGSATCRPCHLAEYAAWKGSDHERAMQPATDATVLGDFCNASLTTGSVTATFRKEGERFVVNTDGPDGALHDYDVKFTFGVRPLQQYLVEFPGGRFQALPLAWDSRPKEYGGQHWFHLYPSENLTPDDQLHWTGLYQNWNLQCASCHSTHLHKNYDKKTHTYATTSAELDVACESCHGPGRAHAAWAATAKPPYAATDHKALAVLLRRRPEEQWSFATPDARYASQAPAAAADRSAARTRSNVCSACHARRSSLTEDHVPGASPEDSQNPALLTEPLYYADGQQNDEVYTWGSFTQSKMFARGVTCDDCHDPHTGKTLATGNGLCTKCHNPVVFDQASHHHHEAGSKGVLCVNCHMPTRIYMVIDARRDHSLRVPRPDVSAAVGSPDACTSCHNTATPQWAADAMDLWYGNEWRKRPEYGTTLHAATSDGAKAFSPLMAMAGDSAWPAIVRATAVELAKPLVRPDALPVAKALLADPDPLVRMTAVGLVEPFDAATRVDVVAPLLADPARAVRVEAARVLADAADSSFPMERQKERAASRTEYLDSLASDCDWPSSLASLGNFQQREGNIADAIASYRSALDLDPRLVGGYVNLADTLRSEGKNAEAVDTMKRGLAQLPDAADLHHALGLALVRSGDKTAAVGELAAAARLMPANSRFAYVYAVALNATGRTGQALAALEVANRRHPFDLDILGTLVSIHLEAGHPDVALPYARSIAEALPGDTGIRNLIAQLEAAK